MKFYGKKTCSQSAFFSRDLILLSFKPLGEIFQVLEHGQASIFLALLKMIKYA